MKEETTTEIMDYQTRIKQITKHLRHVQKLEDIAAELEYLITENQENKDIVKLIPASIKSNIFSLIDGFLEKSIEADSILKELESLKN
ncbi:MAG: hypothetical protein K8F60_16300 [Melioribacteraceae bacterium]|jgi:hypothetical protein|nr:hypothetical protein [Melioribacteraceae bacterium]